ATSSSTIRTVIVGVGIGAFLASVARRSADAFGSVSSMSLIGDPAPEEIVPIDRYETWPWQVLKRKLRGSDCDTEKSGSAFPPSPPRRATSRRHTGFDHMTQS